MNQIERLARMRKSILLGVLLGTVIALCVLLYPTFSHHLNYRSSIRYLEGALLIWLLTLLFSIAMYLLYKKNLKKDPSLRPAVNDERVKTNWLRAYRFAFYALIIITMIWKGAEVYFTKDLLMLKLQLPDGPWLVLIGTAISLISSFLYFNRETKDEAKHSQK